MNIKEGVDLKAAPISPKDKIEVEVEVNVEEEEEAAKEIQFKRGKRRSMKLEVKRI